ncbi:MAG: HAD family hydrolase [Deltaproteobacteria bacterium]|nr:HAD family hydrolase [Deltaproteobacteria bacterium]
MTTTPRVQPCVFFDLDGTLTDPQDGIVRSIQYALQQLGRAVPPSASLRKYIGPPLRESFADLLGHEAKVEEAVRLYRERFGTIGLFENAVYPGIPQLLEAIAQRGWAAYVVTSKPVVYASRIVTHFGLSAYFRAIYGSKLDGRLTDKADLIAHVLASEPVSPTYIVMVGDREHDMRGAAAHGIPALGVTYGYGSRAELIAAGARWVCDTPESVYSALRDHFSQNV